MNASSITTSARTAHLRDRAIGAVLASATGDALGAPYEFGPSHPDDWSPVFGRGKGGEATGGWTDDTAMAIGILDALADGHDLATETGVQDVIDRWYRWRDEDGRGIGIQTREVMNAAGDDRTEARLRAAAEAHHERSGRSGGNGSLMRIGPLALAHLGDGDEAGLAAAAERVTRLTHWEADNVDACVLWALAIRHAIRTGRLDAAVGLAFVPEGARRTRWAARIDEALAADAHPRDFAATAEGSNGWVVRAFQAALAAVAGASGVPDAIERAVRGGRDTDTVAAIAGALAGARWGSTQVPQSWQRRLHGWPTYRATDLRRQAVLAMRHGEPDACGWPTAPRVDVTGHPHTDPVQHPADDGVWLGSQSALSRLPASVGAVVSLARVGSAQVPEGVESVQVLLVDTDGHNLNLDRTLADATDVIAELRAEGTEVFVHCVAAASRTAAVAALYAARHRGVGLTDAWADAARVLPHFAPQRFIRDAVARVVAGG